MSIPRGARAQVTAAGLGIPAAVRRAQVVAATGVPVALGRRLVLAGAVLAALAALGTLVFALAWAVGGSARLAERGRVAEPPARVLELTGTYTPRAAPGAAPHTGLVVVTDLNGVTRVVRGGFVTDGA